MVDGKYKLQVEEIWGDAAQHMRIWIPSPGRWDGIRISAGRQHHDLTLSLQDEESIMQCKSIDADNIGISMNVEEAKEIVKALNMMIAFLIERDGQTEGEVG